MPKALVRRRLAGSRAVAGARRRRLRRRDRGARRRRRRGAAAARRRRRRRRGRRRRLGRGHGRLAARRAARRCDDRRRPRRWCTLVDLPDVGADVVRRRARPAAAPATLAGRRTTAARPPGADRPRPLGRRGRAAAAGDQGARDYLARPRASSSSSAATSPPGATWTAPNLSANPRRRVAWTDMELDDLTGPPPTIAAPRSAAPATSPTTSWRRSSSSPCGCSGRCCSRASPAPARPRWPRRSPRRSTCR